MFSRSINQPQIDARQARLAARQERGLAPPKPPSKINEELKRISLGETENQDLNAIRGLETKFNTLFVSMITSFTQPLKLELLSKILQVDDSRNHPDFAFYLNTEKLEREPITQEALINKELNESFQINFNPASRAGIKIGLDAIVTEELKNAVIFFRYFDLVQKVIENNISFPVGKNLYILQKFYKSTHDYQGDTPYDELINFDRTERPSILYQISRYMNFNRQARRALFVKLFSDTGLYRELIRKYEEEDEEDKLWVSPIRIQGIIDSAYFHSIVFALTLKNWPIKVTVTTPIFIGTGPGDANQVNFQIKGIKDFLEKNKIKLTYTREQSKKK